jgi:hypothetical protein
LEHHSLQLIQNDSNTSEYGYEMGQIKDTTNYEMRK